MTKINLKMMSAQQLFDLHFSMRNELIRKGVIRGNNWTRDIGEYYARKCYKLKLAKSKNNKGYDGIDTRGNKYQVKTRMVFDDWDFISVFQGFKKEKKFSFDYAVCICLDQRFRIVFMAKLPYYLVKKNLSRRGSLSLNSDITRHPKFKIHESTTKEAKDWLLDIDRK